MHDESNWLNVCAVLIPILLFAAAGCGPDYQTSQGETAIQFNKSIITTEEFDDLIKFQAYVDPELDITTESRDRFVDCLIRKEPPDPCPSGFKD